MRSLGRENILRPLVRLRQHALVHSRIIALVQTVQTPWVLEEYSYLGGAGRIKRKLIR